MFNLIFTLLAIMLSSPVALAAQVNLLCKSDFTSLRTLNAVYEKTTVTTPTGPQTVYAITSMVYTRSFAPASEIAGDKGQHLASGECGLAAAILQNVSTDPASLPTISFEGFQTYTGSVTTFNASGGVTTTFLNGGALLPSCSTNVYQFVAQQAPNPNIFEVVGDAAATCVF